MRAQMSLPAVGLAFLVLTAVAVLGVAVADGVAISAERSSLDRQAAVALSDRLVGADAPVTERANVLNETALAKLNATALRTQYGLADGADAEVTLDGEPVATTGDVDDGVTIERLAVVVERHNRTITPPFVGTNRVTIPRRTSRVRIDIRPSNATVRTVRAGDRVVLHNSSGLRGEYTVSLSRRRTAELAFESTDRLATDAVEITYYPVETRKARLGVTVDG